jgi:hypothetical protein
MVYTELGSAAQNSSKLMLLCCHSHAGPHQSPSRLDWQKAWLTYSTGLVTGTQLSHQSGQHPISFMKELMNNLPKTNMQFKSSMQCNEYILRSMQSKWIIVPSTSVAWRRYNCWTQEDLFFTGILPKPKGAPQGSAALQLAAPA